ncbi:uncharacterized protein VTP21DRAFT_73 [Calcarisporiella thermophila]|uniref:uncharacterized protein n=1 Tax=Calcarisporiella thermophila TaxID=911321 RepID=UPI0037424633
MSQDNLSQLYHFPFSPIAQAPLFQPTSIQSPHYDQLPPVTLEPPSPKRPGIGRGLNRRNSTNKFVRILYRMVDDAQNSHLIRWSESGTSFLFHTTPEFTELLSRHFKHEKLPSFLRQLNMYNFTKANKTPRAARADDGIMEYKHDDFRRGQPKLLDRIRRRSCQDARPPYLPLLRDPSDPSLNPKADEALRELEQLKTNLSQLTRKQNMLIGQIDAVGSCMGLVLRQLGFQVPDDLANFASRLNIPFITVTSSSSTPLAGTSAYTSSGEDEERLPREGSYPLFMEEECDFGLGSYYY